MHELGKEIAQKGYTVLGPRLSGHGTHPEDMEKTTYQDWMKDIEKGFRELKETCTQIFVIGLSMGGTLTLYLAEKYPEIKGIIPINAAVDLPGMKDYYNQIKNNDERFVDGIGSDIKMADVEELAYSKTPVKSMGDLLKLMEPIRRNLDKITVPTLIISSKVDHVVPPENSKEIFESISSNNKRIIYLEDSYHVATLDHDKERIAKECISFIERLID